MSFRGLLTMLLLTLLVCAPCIASTCELRCAGMSAGGACHEALRTAAPSESMGGMQCGHAVPAGFASEVSHRALSGPAHTTMHATLAGACATHSVLGTIVPGATRTAGLGVPPALFVRTASHVTDVSRKTSRPREPAFSSWSSSTQASGILRV